MRNVSCAIWNSEVSMTAPASWGLTPELEALRASVATFMRREVLPVEDELPHDAFQVPEPQLAQLRAKARRSGLWALSSPEEHGGAGLGLLAQCVVAEEAAKCRMGAYVPAAGAFGFDPPGVVFEGTDHQIEQYGRPAVEAGDHRTFVAISEPGGGSDPARSIATTARRRGSDWVLNGTKLWISGADDAVWGLVFARTGEGRDGISCFIVDTDQDGFQVSTIPVMRSWAPCEVVLRDCLVPEANLLGEEGQGLRTVQRWAVSARVTYAAGVLGVAQRALEIATEYARGREAFGSPLASKQAIQWMLADSEVELRAARLLTWSAAARADQGEEYMVDASIAKLYATETAGRIVDRAIQVLGGLGVSHELPLERWYRELRIKRIGEGPSEVHRMVVARSLLGRPA
jgi:acyl-CoA dehydrogenase